MNINHQMLDGRDFIPLGIDIETSSSDFNNGVILSIGAYDPSGNNWTGRYFYTEICYTGSIPVNAEAMRVNKLPITGIDNPELPTLHGASEQLEAWLGHRTRRYIPVGFNVASFDIAFIKHYMPIVQRRLGYRAIDLNALIFTEALKNKCKFISLKADYKRKAKIVTEKIVQGRSEHDALYDSILAIIILKNYVRNIDDIKMGNS